MRIVGGHVLTPAGARPAEVHCDGERITAVAPPGAATGGPTIDASEALVAPGLVDLQVNGGFGVDLATAPGRLWELAARLPSTGVTAFLPTLITSPPEAVDEALAALTAGPPDGWTGAIPLGWHLEGPFLAPSAPGVHPVDHLRAPDPALVARWLDRGGVAVMTLAPELAGALEVVGLLRERGVVAAAGHSAATAEEARAAFDAGVTAVTHLFNQMPTLHHRAPGLAGAALADPRIHLGLIADGHHVDPEVLRLVHAAAGPRVVLVTDATAASGLPPGRHRLGPLQVEVAPEGPPYDPAGRLAGSTLTLDAAVRCWRDATGCPLVGAVAAATSHPARLLGLRDRGVLAPGARADVVVLEPDGTVRTTVVGGVLHDPKART